MSDKQVQQKDFQFPTAPLSVHTQLKQVEDEIKRLDSLKKKLRQFLKTAIEVVDVDEKHKRGELEGVIRSSHMRESIAYAKVLAEVEEKLVPKSKKDELEEIRQKYTSQMWVDRYSLSGDDEEDYDGF